METVDISIIVCTYNRAKMLRGALGSLIGQETNGRFSYEIVVIDDGSTDVTSEVVKEVAEHSQVSVRYVYKNGCGIAEARNRGVMEARGLWIAWFDDDQIAENNWLNNLLNIALERGGACVAGPRLLDLTQEQLSRLGPICRDILGEWSWHEAPGRYVGMNVPSTGNLLIHRKVYDSIDLFNSSLFAGGEDTDFVIRARKAGFDIWIAPYAVVRHMIPPYRLEQPYLRWVSLRRGSNIALKDHKHGGSARTFLLCIARIAQAFLVNMPHLLLAYLKGSCGDILDYKCLLWRASGYTRHTLYLLSPIVFRQERFFQEIEFRAERKSFTKK